MKRIQRLEIPLKDIVNHYIGIASGDVLDETKAHRILCDEGYGHDTESELRLDSTIIIQWEDTIY